MASSTSRHPLRYMSVYKVAWHTAVSAQLPQSGGGDVLWTMMTAVTMTLMRLRIKVLWKYAPPTTASRTDIFNSIGYVSL